MTSIEPTEAERVDVVCTNCGNMWSTLPGRTKTIPKQHRHHGNHYVGGAKFNGYRRGMYYTCPNKCMSLNNKPLLLEACDKINNPTPHDVYTKDILLHSLTTLRDEEQVY